MSPAAAWTFIILGFVLPMVHVAISPGLSAPARQSGVDGPPSTCPFSPRTGWLVIVLFLGPIGWLMFLHSRRRNRRAGSLSKNAPTVGHLGEAVPPDAQDDKT